eukprot:scaffold5664_cov115-Isochrysis_galbana.AAC.2
MDGLGSSGSKQMGQLWMMEVGGWGGKAIHIYGPKIDVGGTRQDTYEDCGTLEPCVPSEGMYGVRLEELRARARRGRTCCCQSTVAEDDSQHGYPVSGGSHCIA